MDAQEPDAQGQSRGQDASAHTPMRMDTSSEAP